MISAESFFEGCISSIWSWTSHEYKQTFQDNH